MEALTANLGAARQVTQGNRQYLVAPITLIVPGVLNGSQGPLLYPPDEVAKNPGAWNDVPIVVYHPPAVNGLGQSARDPDVLGKQSVGRLYHATSNGKLTAEAWFDVERLKAVDDRVLRALNLGEKIEVSTGLGLDREVAPPGSTHTDGRPYTHVARNYQPDHLAVLPDQVGACSIKDGCGVLNEDKRTIFERLAKAALGLLPSLNRSDARWIGMTGVTRGHSHRVDLNATGDGWTNAERDHTHRVKAFEVYAQWQEPEGTDRHVHSLDRKTLIDSGVRTNAKPNKPREATPNTKNEESAMDPKKKEALIDSLIANCDCWNEEDREFLEGRDDRSLEVFQTAVANGQKAADIEALNEAATKGFTDPGGATHTWNAETKTWETKTKVEPPPLPVTNTKKDKPKTAEEWMAEAPIEIRRAVTNALELEQAERDRLTRAIIENADDDETKARLQKHTEGLSMDTLRDFAALHKASQSARPPVHNYVGAGAPAGVTNDGFDKTDILPIPSMADLIPKSD